MTQERCLQATVSELLNEWLHWAECKHKFYDPRHNSRVARQLCLGRTEEKLRPGDDFSKNSLARQK